MDGIRIGSPEHKRLFCSVFMETHDPFKPMDIVWPEVDEETRQRLAGLPVWDEALKTEAATAIKVQALGRVEKDPLLAEAISMQGYEEGRHADVIDLLTKHYGISVAAFERPAPPKDPEWAFLRTGYGECLDSFFAFGLFEIGRRSNLFPKTVIDLFDRIMQEEARHILFIVNWAAYLSARTPLPLRPVFHARRAWNIAAQAFDRARGALKMGGDKTPQSGFTMNSHSAFGDFTIRSFFELCLAENERRLAPYDARLLRPGIVPPLVKAALKLMPRGASGSPEARAV